MTNDDERGVKNAENLMTSYVNDPLGHLIGREIFQDKIFQKI